MITYGQIKDTTLQLLDEYSSRGAVLSATKTADYNLKIQSFTNSTIYDLASTTAKIPAVFHVVHNPIKNKLSDDTSTMKVHLPGQDFSISLKNAQSTFFETTGPATVVIEESYNGTTFSPLETIDVPASQVSFAEYKRLIFPSSPSNIVRLRFTGNYIYNFRNYILYQYSWPTEADIPQHRPYSEYPLPADFFDIDSVFIKKDIRIPYLNYVLTQDKKIAVRTYEPPMELEVNYWRRPNLLTFTGTDDIDDAQVIDLDDDAAIIIPWFVAGDILNSEQLLKEGKQRLEQAEIKRRNLIKNKSNYGQTIINVTGW